MRLVAAPRIDDSGVRKSCEIEASKRVAHALGFGRGPGTHHLAGERGAVERGGGLLGQCVEQRARFGIERHRAFALGDADHAERLVADAQRHEIPRNDRQRAGVGAGRLDMAIGPARGGHGGGVERVLRRPGRRQAPDRRLARSSTTTGRPRLAWISLAAPSATRVLRRQSRQAAGEFIEPPHRPHAAGRDARLLAHASRHRRSDHRDDQEDDQREQLVRLGDGEGVERRDEEEIVDGKRQDRRVDRRPDAEAHGGEQHREQEHHRQIRNRRQTGQDLADASAATTASVA